MKDLLDKYLEQHDMTRYQLAKESGIRATTWQSVNDRELNRWTVKQVRALAACMGRAASTVLSELEELDNAKQESKLSR